LAEFGMLLDYRATRDAWPVARLVRTASELVVASVSVMRRTSEGEVWNASIDGYDPSGATTRLLEAQDARVTHLVGGADTVAAILENGVGRRQLVILER